jgi:hypothetical protein
VFSSSFEYPSLLCAHVAYESKRAYVFQKYYWPDRKCCYPWQFNDKTWQLKGEHWPTTPFNAFLSGPVAGGPWDPGDPAPRSVSEEYFQLVCPPHDTDVITTDSVKPSLEGADGAIIFNRWTQVIRDSPKRCVEVVPANVTIDEYPQLFDLWVVSTPRILSLWPLFRDSPVSRLLGPSPLAESVVVRNRYLFLPQGPKPSFPAPRDPFERTMAIHVRQGEFAKACSDFAKWNSTWYGWNQLPELPDKFIPPIGDMPGDETPDIIPYYLEHCLPSTDMLINKIHKSRDDYIANGMHRHLDVMFLLTDGTTEWVNQFKAALSKDGWHTIVTSKDIQYADDEQLGVNLMVDMDIARRAAVFIGNGVSACHFHHIKCGLTCRR